MIGILGKPFVAFPGPKLPCPRNQAMDSLKDYYFKITPKIGQMRVFLWVFIILGLFYLGQNYFLE